MLEVKNISKAYPGVRALQSVSLKLNRGEILGVVGENGAGKSTLMKIISGLEYPDSGSIWLNQQELQIFSPAAALQAGIALIHQELCQCDNLDVASNVLLGREPRTRLGLLDYSALYEQAQIYLEQVGFKDSSRQPLKKLSIAQRQLAEIAKALSSEAKILIMDEPTSCLSLPEVERLLSLVRNLAASGIGIIYISHRLEEITALAQRALVLRDGEVTGLLTAEEINRNELISRMVGRQASELYERGVSSPGAVVLRTKDLRTSLFPERTINLEVRAGEVLGLAGLIGAGRSAVLETIMGLETALGGSRELLGKELLNPKVSELLEQGLVLIPEDRKRQGLFLEQSVTENATVGSLKKLSSFTLLNPRRCLALAQEIIKNFMVKCSRPTVAIRTLSGGNQQKVILGRWLQNNPKVVLLDEPTRGIDIKAKQEIYELIDRLTAQQVGVLLVSSELDELMRLSDRIVAICNGELCGELSKAEFSEAAIMQLATARF